MPDPIRFDQDFLIGKIKKWLAQKNYHPDIENRLLKGICAGFVTSWLYYSSQKKKSYFYNLICELARWDEVSNKDAIFEELCNFLFFFQFPETVISQLFQTRLAEKINFLLPRKPQIAPAEFQFSGLYTEKELIVFFKKLLPELKEKLVFISCGGHICGVYIDDQDRLAFYDPNCPRGGLYCKDAEELTKNIAKSFALFSEKFIPFSITVLDYQGKKAGNYRELGFYFPSDQCYEFAKRRNSNSFITPLYLASAYNQTQMAQHLIALGVVPDNAIWPAATMGALELMNFLIKVGGDINEMSYEGHTAIYYATLYDQLPCVESLLRQKAKTNLDKNDFFPLFLAAELGRIETVKLFLKFNTPVDQCNAEGVQAIHVACKHGRYELVKFLITAGAKTTALTQKNETPLLFALNSGNKELIKFLKEDKEGFQLTLMNAIKIKDVDTIKKLVNDCDFDVIALARAALRGKYSPRFYKPADEDYILKLLMGLLPQPAAARPALANHGALGG